MSFRPLPSSWSHGWRSHVVNAVFSLIVSAAALAYVLNLSPATVRSAAELTRVGYGWPLPWLLQDRSDSGYVDFPVSISYAAYKYSPGTPTSVDGIALTLDVLIVATIVFAVVTVVVALGRRWFQDRDAGSQPSAA